MSKKKKLRLLIMIDSLGCGGAEKSLVSLLPFLVEREYDISLMIRSRGGLFEQYVPKRVKILNFPYKASWLREKIFSLALRLPWNKKRHLAEVYWEFVGQYLPELKEKYDVAIAYQQGFPTFYTADKVKANKKFSWTNADLRGVGYSPKFCDPFYRKFDKTIAVADRLREKVIIPFFVHNANKVVTVWDILNVDLIKKMALEKVPFDKSDEKLQLVTVGRLVPLKGYDMAIKAAHILKEGGLDFVWHIIGGGTIEGDLRNQIKEKGLEDYMVLEGEQANPYTYIANCDIYIQTSRYEGFGLTVAEAKILGKPVVSTNFEVIHNQIINRKNGLIVEMSGEAIAEGIMEFATNQALRKEIEKAVAMETNATAITESTKVISFIEGK